MGDVGLGSLSALALGFVVLGSAGASAQTVPNAGSLQRQLRQDGLPALPGGVPVPPADTTEPADTGERVLVRKIVVDGATLIPAAELEAQLGDRIGQSLSLGGLQAATQVIADYYRSHGYFARAFLPAQDATGGTIHIQVVEGRFGQILRPDGSSTRADSDFVAGVVGQKLQPGAPYSAAALERGLLLANDLPGISADGVLKAGSEPGTSDLGLTVSDTPFLTGLLGANNYGTKSTGRAQGNGTLALNDLLGIGDQLTVSGIGAERLGYGQLGYSLPIGTSGLRAGVSTSYLAYWLGGDFKDLDGHGIATTYGATLSYPVQRTSASSLWLGLDYNHGRYDDDSLQEALNRKRIDAGGFSVTGNSSDAWGGGGYTSYALKLTMGSLDLRVNELQDELTTKAQGSYTKMALDLARNQALTPDLFLRGRLSGQWSSGNLDSSEQFALGGPNGVRAYPVNEGIGDQGLLANLELHHPFSEGWIAGLDLYGFFDAGVVRQHADTWAGWNAGSDMPNTYPLFGAGLGVSYSLAGFNLDLVVAAPIGANQGSDRSGYNQDGSPTDPRAWVSLTKNF